MHSIDHMKIMAGIERALQDELRKTVEGAVEKAIESAKKEAMSKVNQIALNLYRYYRVDMDQDNLTISIRIPQDNPSTGEVV